jgi:hypothetical protein
LGQHTPPDFKITVNLKLKFEVIHSIMEIEIKNLERVKVVYISGDLNAATSGEAESKIQQLIMGGNHSLIINLQNLNYISRFLKSPAS